MNARLQALWWLGLRRLGVTGMLAVGLLVVALLIGLALPGLMKRSDDLRASLVRRAEEVSRQARSTRPVGAADRNGELIAGFPALTQSAADLAQVFAAAQARKITLVKGDYQFKAEPGAPLVSLTATFPVRNEYGAIKGFTADVLTALPHVSMDELRMARPDAGSGVLESVIRFTFVYRSR
jgi:hypothetical protein